MSSIEEAYSLAEAALAQDLPDRWLHVQGVANLARKLAEALPDVDACALEQSAWLHDIGYAASTAGTGFHPLDGARYLRKQGISGDVVALVAHHSAAAIEAQLRGIRGLETFLDNVTATRDALWFCDASTGPQGQRWEPHERWTEVRQRYGPGHLVSRFLDRAEPELRLAVRRTESRMSAAEI